MCITLRSIDDHAGQLYGLIIDSFCYQSDNNVWEKWEQPLTHLGLAAGIRDVKFIRYNSSFGMCSQADYADMLQQDLEAKLVTSLCRFNFIWSSLETIIDLIVPRKILKKPRGKINNACYFIKNEMLLSMSFPAYIEALDELKEKANKSSYYGNIIESNLDYKNHVSTYGLGIFLAYKLRNKLVHGSLEIPETRQEDEKHEENEFVELCCRLVLYSIQMFTLFFWKDKYPVIEHYSEENIDIYHLLTNIQYKENIVDIPEQLKLFI